MDNTQTINAPQYISKGGKFMAHHDNRNNNYNGTPDFTEGMNETNEQPIDPSFNNDPMNQPHVNEPMLNDPQEQEPTLDRPVNLDEPIDKIPDASRNEEFATEITADDDREMNRQEESEGFQANSVMGWIALILSIASYFMMPVILGGAGIILGFIARNRGANTLGNTAIVAGIVSIIITLFILPFV